MIDAAQIVLLAVIVALTVLLVFLGIQIFFTLLEFRKTLKKANKVLDDLGVVSAAVASPISAFSSLVSMITILRKNNFLSTIIAALNSGLMAKKDKKNPVFEKKQEKVTQEKEKKVESTNGELKQEEEEEKPPIRRFFKGIPKRYY